MSTYEQELAVENGREQVIARLVFESAAFSQINARVNRDDGLNQAANEDKKHSIKYIDKLLDKLLDLDPTLRNEGDEDDPETTAGGWHNGQA